MRNKINLKNLFSKSKPNIDLVLLRISGISYSKDLNIYVLFLEEDTKERKIAIIINFFEAQTIAIEIEKIKSPIISIHDVIGNLYKVFKLKFDKIIIFDDNSKLICGNKQKTEIEIKPSDAILLSLRLKIPIYISDKLLTNINSLLNKNYDIKRMSQMEKLSDYSVDDLTNFLNLAIEKEDYENASIIRDEINKKIN